MGFAFLVENCNVSQRRRLVGVIGNGFCFFYTSCGCFVFCCFTPYKMIVHGARKGWQEHCKKEVCGGFVFDKTIKRGSISGGGKRGVLGNTSFIMASSGKETKGGRRRGEEGSFPLSRMFVVYFIVLSFLLTLLKHLSGLLYVSCHDS